MIVATARGTALPPSFANLAMMNIWTYALKTLSFSAPKNCVAFIHPNECRRSLRKRLKVSAMVLEKVLGVGEGVGPWAPGAGFQGAGARTRA